jgi:hypothetical protein
MSNPLNVVAILFGVLLVLKKIADMERFFSFRMFLIIAVLCFATIVLFLGYVLELLSPGLRNCMPDIQQQF